MIVEAHTVGQDDWTTLPDLNGGTQTGPPAECTTGGLPARRCTRSCATTSAGRTCAAAGHERARGTRSRAPAAAGTRSRSTCPPTRASRSRCRSRYVTDPGGGGVGAFVDDTRARDRRHDDRATGSRARRAPGPSAGPPPGSPPNGGNWLIGGQLVNFFAGTSTDDTLLLGFGLEQVAAPPTARR